MTYVHSASGSLTVLMTFVNVLKRLPAEELSKAKWIKASAKTPVSVLKELIARYESWQRGGGIRASLAEPLAWEEDEENE